MLDFGSPRCVVERSIFALTRMRSLSLVCSLVLTLACAVDEPRLHVKIDPEYDRWADTLDINFKAMARQPSGLYVQEVELGTGREAARGDTVAVHYEGHLPNGALFDSSHLRGQPIQFVLGAQQVITGWDEGITGLRVGGKRRLVIPSELAYGERAIPGVIPAHSNLVFDVELMGVR
jgi:FKBP-type peptidyl-prolyl cis-trans isomerase FkpA